MSKPNKANRNNYTQSGRLTPDEMARERMKQAKPDTSRADERVKAGPSSEWTQHGEPASTRDRSEREE
jgi:hypothetical protein